MLSPDEPRCQSWFSQRRHLITGHHRLTGRHRLFGRSSSFVKHGSAKVA